MLCPLPSVLRDTSRSFPIRGAWSKMGALRSWEVVMARRTSSRSRRSVRLEPVERLLFILGATVYVVGVFGGIGLLAMPMSTAVVLLAVGGGLQLFVNLRLQF